MQQFLKKLDIGFADLYVVGFIMCIGTAEVSHMAGLFLGLPMGTVTTVWAGLFGVLLLIWLGFGYKYKAKRNDAWQCHKALPIVFMLLVLVQMLYLFCMQQVNTPGDIMLETVATFLQEDGIHKVNPLTGGAYVNPISTRYKILCLPTLYGALCRLTGLSPAVVIYHWVPLFVLGGCYLAYYKLSGVLFKGHLGRRYTFMIIVALLFWFMDGAVYLDGYGAMQTGYLGTGIRSLILLPWTLTHALKKEWWHCILCILAELCICQTMWGLGFCLLTTVVVVILHLCEEKNVPLRKEKQSKEVAS